MSRAARLNDKSTGHDACAPVPLVSASGDVFINGRGAARIGDSFAPHSCHVHPSHSGTVASGSLSVFINGRGAARLDDSVSCGGSIAEGSGDVWIGG